jgi:hypothetical protein
MQSVTSNAVAQAMNGFIKTIRVDYVTDINGNVVINLGRDKIVLGFIGDAGSLDVNYNLFNSTTTGFWYVHASNFSGSVVSSGLAVKGTVYYI